jgi:hypothetical protein
MSPRIRKGQKPKFLPSKSERETAINRFDDSKAWDVFTSSPVVNKLLLVKGWTPDEAWNGLGARFFVPLKAITIRSKSAMKRKKVASAGKVPVWVKR